MSSASKKLPFHASIIAMIGGLSPALSTDVAKGQFIAQMVDTTVIPADEVGNIKTALSDAIAKLSVPRAGVYAAAIRRELEKGLHNLGELDPAEKGVRSGMPASALGGKHNGSGHRATT